MYKTKFQTAHEYFESQPKDARKKLLELKAIIRKVAPHAEELINYDIPAYALAEGGKRDKQIMIAGYKNFTSLYVGTNILNHLEKELENHKTGKASVQFPNNKALPEKLIVKIIRLKIRSVQ